MKMLKKKIMQIIKDYLFLKGYFLEKRTSLSEIKMFIKCLRPYKTNVELIRIGDEKDGGYLLPNDLLDIEACFSPGVGRKSTFEKSLAQQGIKGFLADRSVDSIPDFHDNLFFLKKYVGCYNSEDFITLDKWIETSVLNKKSDLILQMDIEGAEYEVLSSVSEENLERCRIIVIEFHFLHKLWNKRFFDFVNPVIKKILKTHTCVHIHPNNISETSKHLGIEIPPLLEITFLRNDRIAQKDYELNFPHELDRDNTPKPHMALPECWYK